MKIKSRIKYILSGIFMITGILILLIIISCYQSKYKLATSIYQIDSERIQDKIRIVHLTDLHNSEFGIDNEKLVDTVRKAEPDLIFITGDLVNSHDDSETDVAVTLIRQLKDISPVYISLGNQEMRLKNDGIDIESVYTDAGACVLERDYKDIVVNNQDLRIGGIFSYGITSPRLNKKYTDNEEFAWMQEFQNIERYKLLLFHIPNYWTDFNSLEDWDVDVVFSGHVHGGQIRIPFLGGIWAPDYGLFPGKLNGLYYSNEDTWKKLRNDLFEMYAKYDYDPSYYEEHNKYIPSTLVLSRGLGNTEHVPRINNIPEVVIVDLK